MGKRVAILLTFIDHGAAHYGREWAGSTLWRARAGGAEIGIRYADRQRQNIGPPKHRMFRLAAKLACLLVLLLLVAPETSAASKPSDDEIRRALPGSWIVPRDSPDYTETISREVFRSDGTYDFVVYTDRTCTTVVRAIRVKWSVKDGVLISAVPGGPVMHDEVLTIVSGRMTLHSLDDGTTFIREKSEACTGRGA